MVVVVVIFSVSPFSWPFDIDVITDFTTTVLELVSIVSLQIENTRKTINKSSRVWNCVPLAYPIDDRSFKFELFTSELSFICIEDSVLFVCVLNTANRPRI